MKKVSSILQSVLVSFAVLSVISCENKPKETSPLDKSIDLVKARKMIVFKVQEFEDNVNNSDSIAIVDHYASDGSWGETKGRDNLMAAWGNTVRNIAKKGSKVKFTTNSVMTDGEFLFETGLFQFIDKENKVTSEGKYMLVWKQEEGEWKVFRDIGL